jgi:hypothetical protein
MELCDFRNLSMAHKMLSQIQPCFYSLAELLGGNGREPGRDMNRVHMAVKSSEVKSPVLETTPLDQPSLSILSGTSWLLLLRPDMFLKAQGTPWHLETTYKLHIEGDGHSPPPSPYKHSPPVLPTPLQMISSFSIP